MIELNSSGPETFRLESSDIPEFATWCDGLGKDANVWLDDVLRLGPFQLWQDQDEKILKLEHRDMKALNINEQLKKAIEEDTNCYTKAKARGEQTFTLVARDPTRVICEWIKENIETAPPEKLVDALLDALAMREHPEKRSAD